MTDEELRKIKACKSLLPDPGPEVVGQLIDELDGLREVVTKQRKEILDLKKRLALCIVERRMLQREKSKGKTEA
jgi:hypothetical protein